MTDKIDWIHRVDGVPPIGARIRFVSSSGREMGAVGRVGVVVACPAGDDFYAGVGDDVRIAPADSGGVLLIPSKTYHWWAYCDDAPAGAVTADEVRDTLQAAREAEPGTPFVRAWAAVNETLKARGAPELTFGPWRETWEEMLAAAGRRALDAALARAAH